MDAAAIESWHLPYAAELESRKVDAVTLVVIHCTELPDLTMARTYGEKILYVDSGTGNSGHYYIDRDGRIYEFVPVTRVAHHTRGYNPRSVGIELVNTGRYPEWFHSQKQEATEPYTEAQISSLRGLLRQLRTTLPMLEHIAGHEDLDQARVPASDDPAQTVWRKRDPGALFPWTEVLDGSGLSRIERDHNEP